MDGAVAVIGTLALVHGSGIKDTYANITDFTKARITIISMLLEAGASIDGRNIDGNTALDWLTKPDGRRSRQFWRIKT